MSTESINALKTLLVETNGKRQVKWYMAQTGYSATTVNEYKSRLGLTKNRKKATNVNNDPLATEMTEFASDLAISVIGRNDTYEVVKIKLREVMDQMKANFPQATKDLVELVRHRLRKEWLTNAPIQIDTNSGYLNALRLPLNRIAEAVV